MRTFLLLVCCWILTGYSQEKQQSLLEEIEGVIEKHKKDQATNEVESQLKNLEQKITEVQLSLDAMHQKLSEPEKTEEKISTYYSDCHSEPPAETTCCEYQFTPNWVLDLHFLYWQTLNRDHIYGLQGLISGPFLDWQTVESESSPGFRAGLGVELACDWFLNLDYTYYQNQSVGTSSGNPDEGTGIIPLFGAGGAFGSSQGTLTLNYHVGDLLFKNSIWIKDRVEITPKFGATGASIREKLRISYNEGVPGQNDGLAERLNLQFQWWGVGMKGGSSFRFLLPQNFYFAGETYLGLYLGKGETKNTGRRVEDDGVWQEIFEIGSASKNLTPALQGILGFGWDRDFDNCWRLGLSASWEFNYWWELWQGFNTFIIGSNPPEVDITYKSLKLQGLNLKIDLGF